MVRGSAALLALGAGIAYFLAAASLPDAGAEVAAAFGAVAVAACALALVPAREEPVGLAAFGFGAVLLAVALNARDVGPEATPVEALFGAAAGLLFGLAFGVPGAVVALPVLVAGIDAASLAGGADSVMRAGGQPDVLTLDLPRWGADGTVAQLGVLDATFLAMFASWAIRFDLRPRLAIGLMVSGLTASVALGAGLERALPTLPFLAAGLLLAASNRVAHLLRREG